MPCPVVVEPRPLDDLSEVEWWRWSVLVRAGYSVPTAKLIAERTDVDLHRAVELVEAGCRHDVAALIVL